MPSAILPKTKYATEDHPFIPAAKTASRSPCPALNALSNHGYIPRSGTEISFSLLLHAVQNVYNLSFPLALLVTAAGYVTSARFSLRTMSWRLNLGDLSARGWDKIAHDAAFVHPSGIPSHAPDPALVENLLNAAQPGMTLQGLAALHAEREETLARPLSGFHKQVALGECSLAWLVLRNARTGVIEPETLAQWFGEERLPKGWWEESRRPANMVGLVQTRKTAGQVQQLVEQASRT